MAWVSVVGWLGGTKAIWTPQGEIENPQFSMIVSL
jgi:hypothetical protein